MKWTLSHFRLLGTLLLCQVCLPSLASGDDEMDESGWGLSGETRPMPAEIPEEFEEKFQPEPTVEEPPAVFEAPVQPRYAPAKVVDPVSRRFELTEESDRKFDAWMHLLCNQDAVAVSESFQCRPRRSNGKIIGVTARRPQKKMGSLLLLLENYAENIRRRDSKAGKNAQDLIIDPAIAQKICLGTGTKGTYQELSAKSAFDKNILSYSTAIKSNFYELRELSDLNGKSETLPMAEKIIAKIKAHSTCQLSAVRQKFRRLQISGSKPR